MADGDGIVLEDLSGGVWSAPGARIIDRSGRKKLPIGRDGFVSAMENGTLVDKTMLIADVLESGYAVTLFCRPRRFGKTLNMTTMRAFFESADSGGLAREEAAGVFGVQRISKESIFSDLNNLYVSTSLDSDFDERYGFTDMEVQAPAAYLRHGDCMPEAREWHDGYRFRRGNRRAAATR